MTRPQARSADGQNRAPDVEAISSSASAPNQKPDATDAKIFPRNLTARAEFRVDGNPIVTRPEDAVANCFPGLELDIRNLDRRFFPGLVFNFVEPAGDPKPGMQYGAKLAYLDVLEDPDMQLNLEETQHRLYDVIKVPRKVAADLYAQLTGTAAASLATGDWYLEWIKQGTRSITTRKGGPLTGLVVWRLVRALEPGLVSIGLKQRGAGKTVIELHGWRRHYTDPITGVISGAYQPGELMQGLCSPWQHDFRDCYCHYWASNRPDLVFGDVYPGEPVLPDGEAVDPSLNVRLDWMRVDRSRELAVGAFGIIEKNRPYQFDHFQINKEWQNLNIVLNGREINSVRLANPDDAANAYQSAIQLAEQLREFLAPLELTFVFEYLFARFSLRNPADVSDQQLSDALTLSREYLLLIAISEMQHLRWANEILWELHKSGKIDSYEPVIKLADRMPPEPGGPFLGDRTNPDSIRGYIQAKRKIRFHPKDEAATAKAISAYLDEPTWMNFARLKKEYPDADPNEWRSTELCQLTREVQQLFVNIESPKAFVDSTYSRVAATLDQAGYPPHLVGLARRILQDGMQHESQFNAIQAALRPFSEAQYLRGIVVGSGTVVGPALELRNNIIIALRKAYTAAACDNIGESNNQIYGAREDMQSLLEEGERLAKNNIGIPFFESFPP